MVLSCRVSLGLNVPKLRFLNLLLFDFEKYFFKNVQIQSANEDEMSKFFISAKKQFKNRACGDLARSVLYSTKKRIPSLLSCCLKIVARVNGILEKLILRKTRNKVFRCSTSLFEIGLLIYLIFLHYSSGFIDSLYVDILCLNCGHGSSYVDVTQYRIYFINFLFSPGNKITFIDFCLFKMLV